jgi:heme exporter protein C
MTTTPQQTNMAAASKAGQSAAAPMTGVWWKWGTGLLMAYVILGAFLIAKGGKGFAGGDGDTARIVFFHVPPAMFSSLFFMVAAVYAFRYLKGTGEASLFDLKSAVAMELGFLCCALATITGSVFSGAQWGSYWNWDPRQTTIVFMLLTYAAYLVLRGAAAGDPKRRGNLSASFVLVGLVPSIFLIWVIPRVVESLHPPNVVASRSGMSADYKMVFWPSVLAFALLFLWMFQLRVRQYRLMARRKGA